MAIVAILSALAGPNFYSYIKNKRLEAAAADAYNTFTFARAKALLKGRNVYLVPYVGADWSSGSRALLDGGDGICNTCVGGSGADDDTLIQSTAILGDLLVNASASHLIFKGGGDVNTHFILDYCDDRSDETGKKIRIIASGFMAMHDKENC